MSLELTVLGSGNYAPGRGRVVRNPAGYAVKAGRALLLLDVGFGNVRQLARAGLRPDDVTDVLLTHLHPDHCGDLPALLFARRYQEGPKPLRLRVWGPKGTRALVKALCAAWEPWLNPRGYALEARELSDGGKVQGLGWVAEAKAVPHTAPALAYRVSRGSKSLVYTGDMEYDPALASFAAGCDLLVIESTCDQDDECDGHLSPRKALALVEASRCSRAILTHLSDSSAAAAARITKGSARVSLARDLMRRRL